MRILHKMDLFAFKGNHDIWSSKSKTDHG